MSLKYDPLHKYLLSKRKQTTDVILSFQEIEDIIDARLPKSAFEHQAWWSNQSDVSNRPHAKAWTKAGFKVVSVKQHEKSGQVTFQIG